MESTNLGWNSLTPMTSKGGGNAIGNGIIRSHNLKDRIVTSSESRSGYYSLRQWKTFFPGPGSLIPSTKIVLNWESGSKADVRALRAGSHWKRNQKRKEPFVPQSLARGNRNRKDNVSFLS